MKFIRRLLVLMLWCCGVAQAALPQTINYQGLLTATDGTPVNTAVAMTFRLYSVGTGGSALWTESQPSVTISNGVFNAVLGSQTPIPLPFDTPYWLGVAINADPEMSPRQPLTATGFARRAANADTLAPTATVAGSQISGAISNATLPAASVTGTIANVQLADHSVTQSKLSPTSGAVAGRVLATDGTNLVWQVDANSGGTVTGVTAGTGLTGGTITTSGTIAADTTYLQRRIGSTCSANSYVQAIAADGTVTCGTVSAGAVGTVTSITAGAGLTGGTITGSGTIAIDPASPALTGNFFKLGGNAFGATAVLGATDNQAVEVVSNGLRVLRLEQSSAFRAAPNLIGGSATNTVTSGVVGATIAGGGNELVTNFSDCLGFLCPNQVTDDYGTVGGGAGNTAGNSNAFNYDAVHATVAGGFGNSASGTETTVGGGRNNNASGMAATIAGGSRNLASGLFSTVAGGLTNWATGRSSLAAGEFALADQNNCFVFGGWSSFPGPSLPSCGGYTSVVRFMVDHGFAVDYGSALSSGFGSRWVYMGNLIPNQTIGTWTGAYLTDAGVWVNASSSKSTKTDFATVKPREVLAKVLQLPITTWRYKAGEGEVRHIGPMAEDFWSLFKVGYGSGTIADLDARGVTLAAVQGLHQVVRDKDREISILKANARKTESRLLVLEKLQRKLDAIEARLGIR